VLVDVVHIHRLMMKHEEWSRGLGAWGVPIVATGVFSVWAFYQFPREWSVLTPCHALRTNL
jgi:hypothetical protein